MSKELHHAITTRNPEMEKSLLLRGADPNTKYLGKWTPLTTRTT